MSTHLLAAFGAGNVGRGFVGELFEASGWKVVFVDVDIDLVRTLNSAASYLLETVSNAGTSRRTVEGIAAVHALDREAVDALVTRADLVTTSVGARALPHVAGALASGLRARWDAGGAALDVLLCENLHGAAGAFRDLLKENSPPDLHERLDVQVGLAETSIGRMIPSTTGHTSGADPSRTLVRVEPYRILPFDARALRGPLPQVECLEPVSDVDFTLYTDRKLFVHNLGHCVCAYLGDLHGTEFIWQSIALPDVRHVTQATMTESLAALAGAFGVTPLPLLEHSDDLLARFSNRALRDTNERVGRDPERKMAPGDRFLGAYALAVRTGAPRGFLSLATALGAHRLAVEPGWNRRRALAHVWRCAREVGATDEDISLLASQTESLSHGWDWAEQMRLIDASTSSSPPSSP
ncbi:mannitol-1-phosphate 5-dehydrogenase [Schaalia sp. 19OD2882]|uniref:mannitol dehydrogenase family protein n=1 Tax=Schaalia sp. 19OD2882 TaxID=2794089 RepID=UPI001C1E96C6|nr:mannitol-1-phosphate 5-dehydrogenase [Schaalia sp. 19OD2882]QWW19655.1 mannitol-1-phosphate 5-dehydrogenase [Schaalia sp. 19OD2882]